MYNEKKIAKRLRIIERERRHYEQLFRKELGVYRFLQKHGKTFSEGQQKQLELYGTAVAMMNGAAHHLANGVALMRDAVEVMPDPEVVLILIDATIDFMEDDE